MPFKNVKRRVMGAGVAAGIIASALIGGMGSANASTPDVIMVCSDGSYSSWAQFSNSDPSARTPGIQVATPGQCKKTTVPGGDQGWAVQIWGQYNNGSAFNMGTAGFFYSNGGGCDIYTVDNGPSFQDYC